MLTLHLTERKLLEFCASTGNVELCRFVVRMPVTKMEPEYLLRCKRAAQTRFRSTTYRLALKNLTKSNYHFV
jgi:hypothetical protein